MDTEEGIEDECTCWVCFEVFEDPITLACGHSMCNNCAVKVHAKQPACPFCRRPFGMPLPPVNEELMKKVQDYLAGKDKKMEEQEDRIPQEAPIFDLPEEVILDVFSFLPPKDLCRAARVCKDFKRLADDGFLWRELCLNSFPFCSVDKYGKNWKWCYIGRSSIHKGWEEGKAGDFQVVTLRGHKDYVTAFSLYRNNIVSGSADHNLKIWKADSTAPLNTLVGHNGIINCLQFNEVKIASGASDSALKLWDTRTGLLIKTMNHNGSVNSLQFDDTKVVTGSDDHSVRVWDPRQGTAVLSMNAHYQPVKQIQFDANHIVSSGQDGVRVWDIRNGANLHNLHDPTGSIPSCIQLLSGNKLLTGGQDGQLKLWDLASGQSSNFSGARHYSRINALQCDGKTAVTGCHDGTLKVWDVAHRKLVHTLSEHQKPVHAVQFNGRKIVSGSADNSIKVWDMQKGTRIYTLLGGSLQRRANNPEHPTKPGCSHLEIDESRIVASFASLVRIYDFEVFKAPPS